MALALPLAVALPVAGSQWTSSLARNLAPPRRGSLAAELEAGLPVKAEPDSEVLRDSPSLRLALAVALRVVASDLPVLVQSHCRAVFANGHTANLLSQLPQSGEHWQRSRNGYQSNTGRTY